MGNARQRHGRTRTMGVQLIGIGGTAEDIIVTSEDTTLRSALQARAHTPADDAARTHQSMGVDR